MLGVGVEFVGVIPALAGPGELHLHDSAPQPLPGQMVRTAVDVEHDAVLVGTADAAGQVPAVGEHRPDEPPGRPAPVPLLDQRAVDTGRGDLQDVRRGAHRVGGVQRLGHNSAGVGNVVEVDAAVPVDHNPQHTPATRRRHVEVLEIETGRGDDRGEQRSEALLGRCLAHRQTSFAVLLSTPDRLVPATR